MALQWEPQWEETVVELHGVRLKVPRDRVTGVYACPICGFGEHASYFFSVRDLIYHIYSHASRLEKHAVRIRAEEEGGEEE